MASDTEFAEAPSATHVSRESSSAGTGLTVWSACVAAFLFGVLFVATLLNLAGPRRTIGLALCYTLLTVAPPLVLSLIEHLAKAAGPRKSARRWLLHFQIMLANYASAIPLGILAGYLAPLVVKYFGMSLGIVDLRVADTKGVVSLAGAVMIATLIIDFFFYWYHRSLHASNILWQHHKMHHMDPEFDAMTGPRQNWLENFLSVFFILVPMAVLFKLDGLDTLDLGLLGGLVVGLLRSITFINHTNLRLQFSKASVLFISPQTHRIHHSYLPHHQNKNFAAFFPIWDILFGTYYHPARDEFPLTGVKGEKEIESVWEAQIFAPREWWKLFCARRSNGPSWNKR
jgi:sterol desaturase/sphingolipid hydroxylase (fatty acid hydroxylase superfamily)